MGFFVFLVKRNAFTLIYMTMNGSSHGKESPPLYPKGRDEFASFSHASLSQPARKRYMDILGTSVVLLGYESRNGIWRYRGLL